MGQPFIGEIRMFGGSFAPVGWAFCNGDHLPISENEALFFLLGTTYGGDGESTFALPDLRGRVPVHEGNGVSIGEAYGQESVTLAVQQIPAHVHSHVAAVPAGNTTPLGKLAAVTGLTTMIYADGQGASQASASATAVAGGSQPHQNMMPYLGVNFIISLFGIFPPRN